MPKCVQAKYVVPKIETKNPHKVPAKQWAKWSEDGRRAFNGVYGLLAMVNQQTFSHPKATRIPRDHWGTLRWNIAWATASLITDGGRSSSRHSPNLRLVQFALDRIAVAKKGKWAPEDREIYEKATRELKKAA